jgi:hypothetical protein
MLAVYSSVLKKDKFLKRFADDSAEAASIANELVCDLKSLSVSSSEGKLDSSIDYLKNIEDNLKVLDALLDNLKQNMNGYVSSIVNLPQKQDVVEKVKEQEEMMEEKQETEQQEIKKPASPNLDSKQLTDIVNVMKMLKDMKESLGEDKKV